MCRAVSAGRAADWEGTAGAGQEGGPHRGQAGRADGGTEEPGAPHPGRLCQHRLPGPHSPHSHQTSPGSALNLLRHSEGETLGVGTVEAEMFLTAEVSLATPGALRTTTYSILFRIISSLTDSPVISQAWQKSWFLLSRADSECRKFKSDAICLLGICLQTRRGNEKNQSMKF